MSIKSSHLPSSRVVVWATCHISLHPAPCIYTWLFLSPLRAVCIHIITYTSPFTMTDLPLWCNLILKYFSVYFLSTWVFIYTCTARWSVRKFNINTMLTSMCRLSNPIDWSIILSLPRLLQETRPGSHNDLTFPSPVSVCFTLGDSLAIVCFWHWHFNRIQDNCLYLFFYKFEFYNFIYLCFV